MCKKRGIWALGLLLCLVLSGCGGKDAVSGTVTPNTAPNDTTAPTVEETPVSLGRLEGGVYTNTYAGYGCELDSSWVYYSAEELQELPENINELLADTELGDSMADTTQIMDMKAENAQDLTTINVLYTKLSLEERLAYMVLSEEAMVDGVLTQKDTLIQGYSQAGIEVTSMEKVQVTFLGGPHFAIRTESTTQGVPYYILQVFDYTLGRYGVTLTLASYVEDVTQDLLNLFYSVD